MILNLRQKQTLRVSHNVRQHSRDWLIKRDYYAHSWHNKQQAFECQLHFILGPTLKSKHLSSRHRKADIPSSCWSLPHSNYILKAHYWWLGTWMYKVTGTNLGNWREISTAMISRYHSSKERMKAELCIEVQKFHTQTNLGHQLEVQ